MLAVLIYEGRSITSRTNSFKKITVNNNSKTVLSFFNIISLPINKTFPAFHKSPEARGIEIVVSGVRTFSAVEWLAKYLSRNLHQYC